MINIFSWVTFLILDSDDWHQSQSCIANSRDILIIPLKLHAQIHQYSLPQKITVSWKLFISMLFLRTWIRVLVSCIGNWVIQQTIFKYKTVIEVMDLTHMQLEIFGITKIKLKDRSIVNKDQVFFWRVIGLYPVPLYSLCVHFFF